ncbi:uncharacterized protein LOC144101602 [Amblyomma americanum]
MVMVLGIQILSCHPRREEELLPGGLEPQPPDMPRRDPGGIMVAVGRFVDQQQLHGVLASAVRGGAQRLALRGDHTVDSQREDHGAHGCGLCGKKIAERGVVPPPQRLSAADTDPPGPGAQHPRSNHTWWRPAPQRRGLYPDWPIFLKQSSSFRPWEHAVCGWIGQWEGLLRQPGCISRLPWALGEAAEGTARGSGPGQRVEQCT